MRKIKFRGKRVDNGEWVYGYYVEAGHWQHIFNADKFGSLDAYKVDPATVGQYTGKTVKTGPVCQDDIGKSIDGLFLIVWDEEKAAFMMQFLDGSGERLYLEEMWEDSEIIGNIHDNPKLLEGGKA
jgi:hypothetical protein